MRARLGVVTVILLSSSIAGGAALLVRPGAARGQSAEEARSVAAASSAGRYVLTVLPSRSPTEAREWLVLDSQSGTFTHWREAPGHYDALAGIGVGRTATGIHSDRVRKRDPLRER